MKRHILLSLAALVLLLITSTSAFAQRPAPRNTVAPKRTVAKVNVLSPFTLTGSGFVEHAFSSRVSAQLGAFVTGVTISDVKFKGHGFTPEVRYYLSESKIAPAGPYLAGYARIQDFKLTVDDNDANKQYSASYAPVGGGLAVGNQWIFNSGLALDIFFGAGYNSGSLKVNTGTEDDFDLDFLNILGSGFRIRPGLTIGYNF
ncbi:DUF3575 domain-containing protein [Pontibacter silvestris]|uniref:DUF3575 domain-containing protein n=1 Tax=Pontibacter silvestris TaxID=2305183 RepID=A0ABW4WX73_9BACT|nr:DUF3575 domain-containing protein [Pontibacter silvestris]MCC9138501.1 DUF3575 domain-containing protein [Pontibacter silvestris]